KSPVKTANTARFAIHRSDYLRFLHALPTHPGAGLTCRAAAPGEKAVVFEAGLAVGERGAGEGFDPAAGRFEDGLAGRGVPLHRRAKARVEVGFPGSDHAEFERTAATLALAYRVIGEELGQPPAVFVRAAMDDDQAIRRSTRLNWLWSAAIPPAHCGARPAS